jgi:hypothetical protein
MASTLYDERLTVPWWAWPVAFGAAGMLAAELAMGALYLRHWATFLIAAALAAAGLFALGRVRVRVRVEEAGLVLRVDDACLPMSAIASITPLDPEGRRDLLGPAGEPLAFVIQRPWVPGGVRIDLDDPADPTPYWYISTRRPEALADALRSALP